MGDDCPIDAGGRTVFWLQVVGPESLRYLELPHPPAATSAAQERRLSDAALSAIALHRDAAADVILDRLATADSDTTLRGSRRTRASRC